MTEALYNFIESERFQRVSGIVSSGASTIYQWLSERVWAVYTTGAFVSVLVALGSAHEKQILADHLYGSHAPLQQQQERSNTIEGGKKLLQEEASQGVRQVVWMMPREDFMQEYRERHGI